METRVKSFLATTSSALAIALLAFSLAVGGSRAVRADDPESLPAPVDTVSIPVKDLAALEQRVIYLEEKVAALTQAWQHIDTHGLCVSDAAGAETCITKAQLDALLISQAPATNASPPAAIVGDSNALPSMESVAVAAVAEAPAPAPSAVLNEAPQKDQAPEQTGALTSAVPVTELNIVPNPEIVTPSDQP